MFMGVALVVVTIKWWRIMFSNCPRSSSNNISKLTILLFINIITTRHTHHLCKRP